MVRYSYKPTRMDNRAAAMQYLCVAREPNAETLVRSYGIKPAEAETLMRAETAKRAARP